MEIKRVDTPIKAIALSAIFASLTALMAMLSSFFPVIGFVITLFIPAIGAFVAYISPRKWIWLYPLVALLLSFGLVALSGDFQYFIFSFVPALLSGTLYGLLRQIRMPLSYLILAVAVLESLLNVGAYFISLAIYKTDFISYIIALFNLQNVDILNVLFPLFVFIYSLMEIVISSILIEIVFEKMKLEGFVFTSHSFVYMGLGIFFGLLSVGIAFLEPHCAYLSMGLSFYFSVCSAFVLRKRMPIYIYILYVPLFFLSIVAFAALNSFFPPLAIYNLLSIFLLAFLLPTLIGSLILLKGRKGEGE